LLCWLRARKRLTRKNSARLALKLTERLGSSSLAKNPGLWVGETVSALAGIKAAVRGEKSLCLTCLTFAAIPPDALIRPAGFSADLSGPLDPRLSLMTTANCIGLLECLARRVRAQSSKHHKHDRQN